MLLSCGYSLIIKSLKLDSGHIYFVKLFGSINSRTYRGWGGGVLVCFCNKGNLLHCTKIKVIKILPNKVINFPND